MRLLKINDTFADIDDRTAIGITFQKYDFKNIGSRQVSVSNSFTLPKTAKNINLFSYSDNPQSISQDIYTKYTVNYWIDNEHLIVNGSLRVDEISDRIKVYVVQRDTFWDDLKNYTYQEMIVDLTTWLREEKEVLIYGSDEAIVDFYSGTIDRFVTTFFTNAYVVFSYYYGVLLDNEDSLLIEQDKEIHINGGHFCVYEKYIFEFLENKFGVSFSISDTDTTNLWNDTFVNSVYIPVRNYYVQNYIDNTKWVLRSGIYSDLTVYTGDKIERNEKTAYDYVKSFFQQFNVIIDDSYVGGTYTMKLRRFDDIKDNADVVNFSGKLKPGKIKFKPSIDGFGQVSRIKYASKAESLLDYEGDKLINCNNKNIDPFKELFEIDAYYSDVVVNSDTDSILNLSTDESLQTFVHLISDGTADGITAKRGAGTYTLNGVPIAAIYSITGEYTFIDEILAYPKFYEIEKWLTLYDILNLEFFKQYYIEELGGSFFINKISGFNPEKSNAPTKLELVKISDRTPKPLIEYLTNFYIDGLDNAYTDGLGNYYI